MTIAEIMRTPFIQADPPLLNLPIPVSFSEL